MKASVTTGDSKVTLGSVPVPSPGPGQILVKVIAAAQNPSDWMKINHHITTNIPIGHDFAGVVQELGSDVPAGLRKVGERVAGFINGGATNEIGGTFAEYCLADAEVIISLPDDLSFEDAAGLGLAGFTACQTLWQSQKNLPTPSQPAQEPIPILVWAGASAVGQYVIQLAKLSGLQVITTASPKNHSLMKSLGADAVFDYRDPDVSEKIKAYTGNRLSRAIDCISEGDTPKQVAASLNSEGGFVTVVLPAEVPGDNVQSDFPLVYTLHGQAFEHPYPYPAIPEHRELGKRFGKLLTDLLAEGKLRTTPLKLVPNGVADVQQWIDYQKEGKVRAEKITYRIAETPTVPASL